MTVSKRIPYVRILGYGSGAYSYAFVTTVPSTLPSSGWDAGTTFPVLTAPPTAFSVKFDALETVGSASDLTFQLLFAGTKGASAVGGLLESESLPLSDGSGGYVKTSRYESDTSTTIGVHDSGGITTDDYVWIGGEIMRVTGTTSTTLSVTRAQRDTWARPIPYNVVASGTPVYGDPPSVYGLAVEAGTIDGTTAAPVVYWRGFINAVTVSNGTTVTVKARGLLGYLKDLEIAPPQTLQLPRLFGSVVPSTGTNAGQVTGDVTGFSVDADSYGDPSVHSSTEWDYVRVFASSDKWVVCKCSHKATRTSSNGRRLAEYTLDLTDVDADIVQAGEGDTVLLFDGDVTDDLYDHVQLVLRSPVRAEYVQRVTSAGIGGVGQALLRVNPIAGTTAMLPAAWTDFGGVGLSAARLSLANGLIDSNHYPPSYQGKTLDLLEEMYLAPIFVGVTEDAGALQLVDWAPDISRGSSVTIAAGEHSQSEYAFALRASDARPIVALRQAFRTRGTREYVTQIPNLAGGYLSLTEDTESRNQAIIISELGVITNAWTDIEWIDVIGQSSTAWEGIIQRARSVVDMYDRSLPALTITCRPTANVESIRVGALVTIQRTDLPTSTGLRGATNPRGIVTERSVSLLTGAIELRVLLIDWYASQLARGVWGPAVEVVSWSSPVAKVAANVYTSSAATGDLPTSDAESMADVLAASGQSDIDVDLIDDEGNYRDSGKLTAVNVGTPSVSVSALSVTPAAGDRFILADAPTIDGAGWLTTVVTSGPVGWLADSSGDVDGGTQDGRVYS